MPRTWFITGTSAGLGRALATACLDAGDHVVATARDVGALDGLADGRPGSMLPLALDVTDPASVTDAVDRALAWCDGIDVLVNNAGHGLAGTFEELSTDEVRRILDVNLFGVMAVTRSVLPSMRARGRGHLIQMSSVGGFRANPGHALYATSKFALEGLSEALAAELEPFGIRVTIVEPGPFRTGFAGRSMGFATPLEAYAGTPAAGVRERFASQDGNQPGDPVRAAAAIRRAVDDPEMPLRLPLGADAVSIIRGVLEHRLVDLDRCAELAASADFATSRP